MNDKIVIFGLLIFLSIQNCTINTTGDKLLGHWHRVPSDNWTYRTIDIEDTITITDKYDLLGGAYLEYTRLDKNEKQILPTNFYGQSTIFSIINDTLTIRDSLGTYKYVKSSLNNCLILDRYANCSIKILLENSHTSENYGISYKQFCSDGLFIGKLKPDSNFRDSLSRAFPDSIFIQTRDVLINLSDIPKLCEQVRRVCSDNNNPLNINLHADINVPGKFLKQIESAIPETFSIHTVVNVDNKDIGLNKIR